MSRLSKCFSRLPVAPMRYTANVRVYVASALAVATGCVAILFSSQALLGTTCIEPSQPQAFKAAGIVFQGKVTAIEDTTPKVDVIDKETGKIALQPATPGEPRVITLTV